ncbi:MAG: hypothetical protein DMG97_24415 [Acidobacteria bacterium]|nr:MAG: hypothetical protein DMG97_24415 [Acidobacteriota bacterium]
MPTEFTVKRFRSFLRRLNRGSCWLTPARRANRGLTTGKCSRRILTATDASSRISNVSRMHQALVASDWEGVGRLLREEWKFRRSNAPGITTPLIDKLITVAGRHGGKAAKVCGAGGGGCVIFLVEKGAASRVATAIGDAGARVLPLQVARDGLRLPPV